MKSDGNERLLTVKGAATFLGVAPNTIRAWGAASKIPEYRHPMNNYRLYKERELKRVARSLGSPKRSN